MSKARDIADLDFNAPDIDGGNIDGAVIGGTTAAAGSFSTIAATGATLATAASTSLSITGSTSNSKNIYFRGDSSAQKGRIASIGTSLYFQLNDATNYLTITSSGIDVIGGVTASTLLTVGTNGTEYANNYLRFKSAGTAFIDHLTVGQSINFRTSASSGLDTTPLTIDATGAATFASTISAVGSANSGSASHIPALLGSGNYGGGIATRDGAESGWYQQSSGADWHFYHNRTVASQTPESKKVLSFNSTGEPRFYANVGIGIDPAEMLDIQSTSGDARIRLDAPAASDTEIKFYNAGVSQYTIGHNDAPDTFVIGTTNVDNPLFSITKNGRYYTPNGSQLVRQLEIPFNVTNNVLTYTFEYMDLSLINNDNEGSTSNSAMFFVNVNTYLNKYIHMVVTTDLNAGNSLAYQTLGSIGLTGTASIDATNPQITISISGMWGNSSNYSGRITAS